MMRAGRLLLALLCLGAPVLAWAGAGQDLPGLSKLPANQLSPYLRLLIGLSLLSFVPAALIAMTSFTRIVLTLSFLRHAIGMPETPPNAVLMTLGLLLTAFTMGPTLERSYKDGMEPFLAGKLDTPQAVDRSVLPLKEFMSRHVREEDLRAVSEMAHLEVSATNAADYPLRVLAPAFMLSELRAAFVAGFLIFLPFLLIDLVVAAILMALGMMMMPPVSVSLPLKILLFVLIDGWSLLLRALAGVYD